MALYRVLIYRYNAANWGCVYFVRGFAGSGLGAGSVCAVPALSFEVLGPGFGRDLGLAAGCRVSFAYTYISNTFKCFLMHMTHFIAKSAVP